MITPSIFVMIMFLSVICRFCDGSGRPMRPAPFSQQPFSSSMPHTPSVSSSDSPSPSGSAHSKSPQISPLPPSYLAGLYGRPGNGNINPAAAGLPLYPPPGLPGETTDPRTW